VTAWDDLRARRPTARRLLLGLAEQSSDVADLARPVLVLCRCFQSASESPMRSVLLRMESCSLGKLADGFA
jgi:hypothetical protein